ncbi:MAG: arsenosugar biosynthesis radical SAM protein ArsS [Candidatus Omnitrophica bacterium]|nr:arsenosugar biosynthesis radical SAM protein ArsS [Candidatus Omnitrophota bacterium]
MNPFLNVLESQNIPKESCLKRAELTTLQVNMGDLCNQSCSHCHVGSSPQGKKIMPLEVVDRILEFLSKNRGLILDITGGAPELNPNFDYFLEKARPLAREIVIRSNLTVFFEPGKEYLPEFFKRNNIHLICSLPCYEEKNVDAQRGLGVFEKSIKALQLLNSCGYSQDKELVLDLAYNPKGINLPPQQDILEREYRENLKKSYGVEFNRLVAMTNVPIKRFKEYLEANGEYSNYVRLLEDNFNPDTVTGIMCRRYLSVGYDGKLYDCDFNQSLNWALKDEKAKPLSIDKVDIKDIENRDVMVGEHCFSCTAGFGSSCQGALDIKETVKAYYGKVLKTTKDLKTTACCSVDAMPKKQREYLAKIHPEICDKFYGCGSPIPPLLKDLKVLDLGCGTGRDTYLVSQMVGSRGFVIGVDMTDEQLDIARKHIDYQTEKSGFKKPNVDFRKGYIENLKSVGIKDNSIDLVISNCVINLSPDKIGVFSEVFRVLKPGGEFYFADVFCGRRMPEHLKHDSVLYGECLGGALYIEDFRRSLRKIGCLDYRVVTSRRIALNNKEVEEKVGGIDFYSMTIRAFKLDDLEDICEDYGQTAVYLGTISGCAHQFKLDDHHLFFTGKPMLVCGNTASMLSNTRYGKHFKIVGDKSRHFGPFPCGPTPAASKTDVVKTGGSCC